MSFRTNVSPSTSSGTGVYSQWACRTAHPKKWCGFEM